jgi:hypothetical protein
VNSGRSGGWRDTDRSQQSICPGGGGVLWPSFGSFVCFSSVMYQHFADYVSRHVASGDGGEWWRCGV